MKVLVIEPEAEFRKKAMGFLSQAFPHAEIHPYDPTTSGRPDADFNWTGFDVLILDYHLGGEENGLDWLRAFKHESNRFPATVLLTSAENEDVAVKALRHGAHDFLRKQDLSPHKLAEAIADALNLRYRESGVETSLTLTSAKFSKSFFYGQLDLAFQEAEKNETRALILIRLDGYDGLRRSLGLLVLEDVTRHLANIGLELFRFGRYRPRATRFSDASIGILVGGYENVKSLRAALDKFCERLTASPPVVGENEIPVSVSMGAVVINSSSVDVYDLFGHAETAINKAAAKEGNAFELVHPGIEVEAGDMEQPRAGDFDVQGAVEENRIQAMFGAISAVSDRSVAMKLNDFFEIDAHFVSPAGELVPVSSVFDANSDEILAKAIDRWSIREGIRRVFSDKRSANHSPAFLVDISAASTGDEELSIWLEELVAEFGKEARLGGIFLCISPQVLMANTKQVVPVCRSLSNRLGVRFAIKDLEDPAMCKVCLAQISFDLIVLSNNCTQSLIGKDRASMESRRLLEFAFRKNLLTIAHGIGDANALHGVISAGVDFVHGDFIAPEQEEVEAAIGIETVSIDDTTDWRLQRDA
jgi:EAL domain-containing protein (putative c-di-GMP-specific phosphodiesterase class I)/DNA-binding NarL/FixJ family response regulator